MSDLQRLRRYSYAGEGDEIAELVADLHWAADEIERLTAELEHMTGCRDTQHSIACNLDEETKRLQARVDALEAVVNGGEYDDPYGVWDRVCKYQTAAAEQEGE